MQHKIEFDDGNHIYWVDGVERPSVTQVLEAVGITDYSGVPGDILEQKRRIGDIVHRMIAMDNEDDLGTYDPQMEGYLSSWRQLREKYQMVFKGIERRVYHPVYGYCGTLDVWPEMTWEEKRIESIIDCKTGLMYLGAVGPQTAAYEAALRYEIGGKPMRRFGAKLFETGECGLLVPLTNREDIDVFIHAVSVVNWNNRKHRRF